MSGYFIHTFELTKRIAYEEYERIKKEFQCFPDKINSRYELYPFCSTAYSSEGIIINIRQCTENERKSGATGRNYKLALRINPSRMLEAGTNRNHIENICMLEHAVELLDGRLAGLFGSILNEVRGINDFKLSRLDLTRDIQNVPEHVIQQFLLLMRRLPLQKGFFINSNIQENCSNFRPEDSYNVVNESRGVEFVLYNKHKAAGDQRYSEDEQAYYRDILRMEVRCSRKFIKKHYNKEETEEILRNMYLNSRDIVRELYFSMFRGLTNGCFLSQYFGTKLIRRYCGKKGRKVDKMLLFYGYCGRNRDMDVEEAGDRLFPLGKRFINVKRYFGEMELSPIPVMDQIIPFIQSPDSMLGFAAVGDREREYFERVSRRSRGKAVFIRV